MTGTHDNAKPPNEIRSTFLLIVTGLISIDFFNCIFSAYKANEHDKYRTRSGLADAKRTQSIEVRAVPSRPAQHPTTSGRLALEGTARADARMQPRIPDRAPPSPASHAAGRAAPGTRAFCLACSAVQRPQRPCVSRRPRRRRAVIVTRVYSIRAREAHASAEA